MAHREFRDERGQLWEVWDVVPERRDRRSGAAVSGDLARGWLVFASPLERRRYAPLPDRWSEASDEQLNVWRSAARPVPLPRRLIE